MLNFEEWLCRGLGFRIVELKKKCGFSACFLWNLNLCRRRIVINADTFMVEGTILYKFEFILFF